MRNRRNDMKYSIEMTENGVVETLEINGAVYKKEWIYIAQGHLFCKQRDFSEQMIEDGLNDELVDKIEDTFDGFIASEVESMRDYLK